MKKTIVFLFLLCFSALWCFADEGMEIGEDNQPALFFPGLSLSTVGFSGNLINPSLIDHSALKPVWGMGTLEWGQSDLKIKKYSEGGSGMGVLGITLGVVGITVLLVVLIVLVAE